MYTIPFSDSHQMFDTMSASLRYATYYLTHILLLLNYSFGIYYLQLLHTI